MSLALSLVNYLDADGAVLKYIIILFQFSVTGFSLLGEGFDLKTIGVQFEVEFR
jgi:hypothetical protein